MKQYAYCPIVIQASEAKEYAQPFLKEGHTIVIHKSFDGVLSHTENPNTSKNHANSYGYDLYLIDASTDKMLSCGDFN